MIGRFLLLVLICTFWGNVFCSGEEFYLKSGEVIKGEVVEEKESSLILQVEHGTIEILKKDISEKGKPKKRLQRKKTKPKKKNFDFEAWLSKVKQVAKGFNVELIGYFLLLLLIFYFLRQHPFILTILLAVLLGGGWYFFGNPFSGDMTARGYTNYMYEKTLEIHQASEDHLSGVKVCVNNFRQLQAIKEKFKDLQMMFRSYRTDLLNLHVPEIFEDFHRDYLDFLSRSDQVLVRVTTTLGSRSKRNYEMIGRQLCLIAQEELSLAKRFRLICKKHNIRNIKWTMEDLEKVEVPMETNSMIQERNNCSI